MHKILPELTLAVCHPLRGALLYQMSYQGFHLGLDSNQLQK
jgi:hypothetical protein